MARAFLKGLASICDVVHVHPTICKACEETAGFYPRRAAKTFSHSRYFSRRKRLTTWSLKTLHKHAIQKKTFTMNCRGQPKRRPICRRKLLSAHQGGAGRRCYGATCLTSNLSTYMVYIYCVYMVLIRQLSRDAARANLRSRRAPGLGRNHLSCKREYYSRLRQRWFRLKPDARRLPGFARAASRESRPIGMRYQPRR